MKVTVLVENTAPQDSALTPEHGLSLYIQYREHHILLDAGSSQAFARNAQALGINLSQVDLAVLSHGHYDHADGLRYFLEENPTCKVYARPQAGGPYFSTSTGSPRFIGIHRDIWEGRPARECASPSRGCGWCRRPSTAAPLPAGRPICCGSWGQTSLSPTTLSMSTPWCWRAPTAWPSLTPAPTVASSTSSRGCGTPWAGR